MELRLLRGRRIGSALLAGIALLAGACGGNGSGSATASDAACRFVDARDASTLFGMAATQKPDDAIGNAASTCVWQADDTGHHGYLLQVRIYDDDAHYGEAYMPSAQKLNGIADKAFVSNASTPAGVDVQFLRRGKTYAVNYTVTNIMAKVKKNAADQADQLVALVRANVSRL